MKQKTSHAKLLTAKAAKTRIDASPKQKLALGLLSLVIALILAELGLRLLYGSNYARLDDERLSYRHDPELGWFPIPNSSKRISGSRVSHPAAIG